MNDPYEQVLAAFSPWSGIVPAGYSASSVGSLKRIDHMYPGPYLEFLRKKAAADYFEKTAHPKPNHPNYYEVGAVLHAVQKARGQFKMIELGAGTGPWTAMAARAAEQKGLSSRFFVAVEGEPTRYEWLKENLLNNKILPKEFDAIRAAVLSSKNKDKKIYFPVGAPLFAGHRAQALDQELEDSKKKRQIEYVGRKEEAVMEAAPTTSLRDILTKHIHHTFDIAHIDIQGAEDQVVEDAADMLNKRIRAVAIGTHGRQIEEKLIDIFTKLGWKPMFSFPGNASFEVNGTVIDTKGLDGFQHWVNPSL